MTTPYDWSEEQCQPCEGFVKSPDQSEPYHCPCGGLLFFCSACLHDHHRGGWNTCQNNPTYQCTHPACLRRVAEGKR